MKTLKLLVAVTLLACACAKGSPPAPDAARAPSTVPSPLPTAAPESGRGLPERPPWLGKRVLPRASTGYGRIRPTPPALRNRRLPTIDLLAPPRGSKFRAVVRKIPNDVLHRSTWSRRCPVARADLSYLKMSFWGFDNAAHTGEMIVHESVAPDIVAVFRRLHRARFPIEEMRVVAKSELDAPPTGDGNNTTAFVCRPARSSTTWSEHAYGLAVDVNPFHNPYQTGAIVLPELASAYTERRWRRPGMIFAGGIVPEAFASIGWEWGGDWVSVKDWMHFSLRGR